MTLISLLFAAGSSVTAYLGSAHNQQMALFIVYLLLPLLCILIFFVAQINLVINVIGEVRPIGTKPAARECA